jgi:hypothetical protein
MNRKQHRQQCGVVTGVVISLALVLGEFPSEDAYISDAWNH